MRNTNSAPLRYMRHVSKYHLVRVLPNIIKAMAEIVMGPGYTALKDRRSDHYTTILWLLVETSIHYFYRNYLINLLK